MRLSPGGLLLLGMVAGAALLAPSAHAGPFSDLQGHIAAGYGRLLIEDSPSGSLSVGAGLDVPTPAGVRVGLDIGFDLFGSRTVERGSLLASIDYSAFEAILYSHWLPPTGPVERVSLGAALIGARGELSTSGAGIGFADLAVEETGPALAAAVSFGGRSAKPVRLGAEFSVRTAFMDDDPWTIVSLRGVVRY